MTFNGKQVAEAANRLRKRIAKIKEAYKEYDKQIRTNDPKKPSLRWALDGRTPKKLVLKKSTLTFRELFKRSLPSRFKTAKRDRVTIVSLARDKRNLNRLVSRSITYDFTSRPGRLVTRKYNHVVIKLEPNKKFVDSKVLFSCNCVSGDTWVNTESGLRQVKSIAVEKHDPTIDQIYILNGKRTLGTKFWKTGDKEVFELQTDRGYSLKATADHLILVEDYHKPLLFRKKGRCVSNVGLYIRDKWIPISELKIGDKLVLNVNESAGTNVKQAALRPDRLLGYLIGLIVGDGSFFVDGRPDLRLFSDKKRILNYIISNKMVKGFVKLKRKAPYKSGYRVKFNPAFKEALDKYRVTKNNKTLTSKIMRNKAMLAGFLAGIYDTDGSLSKKGKACCIYNTNSKLLKRIQLSLSYFGIVSNFRLSRKAGEAFVCGNDKLSKTKALYMLDISGEHMDRFFDVIKSAHPNKQPTTKHDRDPYQRRTATLVSKEFKGVEAVYDCTVPSHSAFSANGIIVHNCPDFKFSFEVALTKRGNSQIVYSNGEESEIRNPKNIPSLCKHGIMLFKAVLEKRL